MGISPISLLISIGQRAQENQCWCKDTKKVDATTNYTNFFFDSYIKWTLCHLPLEAGVTSLSTIPVSTSAASS